MTDERFYRNLRALRISCAKCGPSGVPLAPRCEPSRVRNSAQSWTSPRPGLQCAPESVRARYLVGIVNLAEKHVEYRRRLDTGEVVPTIRAACGHGCYVLPQAAGGARHIDTSDKSRWRFVADIDSVLSPPLPPEAAHTPPNRFGWHHRALWRERTLVTV